MAFHLFVLALLFRASAGATSSGCGHVRGPVDASCLLQGVHVSHKMLNVLEEDLLVPASAGATSSGCGHLRGCRTDAPAHPVANTTLVLADLAEEVMPPQPHLIPLRRETVPVKRKGKVVSFKTSYSGVIGVGQPAQSFRVVFDTGSGHLVLPSEECGSEACRVHARYNQTASSTALPVNQNGSVVATGAPCDKVTIGFGTGKVKGEFVQDTVCLGAQKGKANGATSDTHCVKMYSVMATEMSTQPFKNFGFDGILGMGLSSLALNKEFSFFDIFSRGLSSPHFGVFLTEGENGEESEIAFGGHNPSRVLTPISWTDVVMKEHGHWMVQILSLRIGGQELDICRDGTCRGVVDTGTSHLGIPAPFDEEVTEMLSMPAGDMLDCRLADLPEMVIELPGLNITLHPKTYMRRLPLRNDVNFDNRVGEKAVAAVNADGNVGLMMPTKESVTYKDGDGDDVLFSPNRAGNVDYIVNRVLKVSNLTLLDINGSRISLDGTSGGNWPSGRSTTVPPGQEHLLSRILELRKRLIPEEEAPENLSTSDTVPSFCRPRLMPVSMPAPLGPKLFILGEPVLHQYYTVYDWSGPRIGMAIANSKRNSVDKSKITDRIGSLPQDMDVFLMQQSVSALSADEPSKDIIDLGCADDVGCDNFALFQVGVVVTFRVSHSVK